MLILSYESEISFTCKLNSFSYEWLCTRPRFEREASGSSEMVYSRFGLQTFGNSRFRNSRLALVNIEDLRFGNSRFGYSRFLAAILKKMWPASYLKFKIQEFKTWAAKS